MPNALTDQFLYGNIQLRHLRNEETLFVNDWALRQRYLFIHLVRLLDSGTLPDHSVVQIIIIGRILMIILGTTYFFNILCILI